MICFWVPSAGAFGIEEWRVDRGAPVAGLFHVLRYEDLARTTHVPAAAHVFSGLDQITAAQREAIRGVQSSLGRSTPPPPVLNRVDDVLLRPALLMLLAEKGVNSFKAFRGTEALKVTRFPVFVRRAHDHNGSLTGLLAGRGALLAALLALRARGQRLSDLLIVEFRDMRDHDGLYRKYAAFRVGDRIVPAHVLAGHDWMVKASVNERTEQLLREDLLFVESNPHEQRLREVFDLARIDYGRVDYGVSNGRLEVWEINLNPTMGRRAGKPRARLPAKAEELRERGRQLAHERLCEAFETLDRRARSASMPVNGFALSGKPQGR